MLQITQMILRKSVDSITHLITDYWILMTPLILSSCMGIYEGGFECPAGEGTGCKSISEVNQMINKGNLPPKTKEESLNTDCKDCEPKNSDPLSKTSSKESQIWFAPHALGVDA